MQIHGILWLEAIIEKGEILCQEVNSCLVFIRLKC